uniref:Uncharacterized protein n=1 Tax=Anguilla anguilla TaxID=7936 RepID=A0A0E9WIZ2_ANGAN
MVAAVAESLASRESQPLTSSGVSPLPFGPQGPTLQYISMRKVSTPASVTGRPTCICSQKGTG